MFKVKNWEVVADNQHMQSSIIGEFKWFFPKEKDCPPLNENDSVYLFSTNTTWTMVDGKLIDSERIIISQTVVPQVVVPLDIIKEALNQFDFLQLIKENPELSSFLRWEDGKSVKIDELAAYLKNDLEFVKSIEGKPGKEGKTLPAQEPNIKLLAKELKSDPEFVELTKGKDADKATPVSLNDVILSLSTNGIFINKVKDSVSLAEIIAEDVVIKVADHLANDEEFIQATTGAPGKEWPKPTKDKIMEAIKEIDIVGQLKLDSEFIEMSKWETGASVKAEEVAAILMKDTIFLETVTGKTGDTISKEEISTFLKADPKFIKMTTGLPGQTLPGEQGEPGEGISIGRSPDGQSNFTTEMKDGDKYISIGLGRRVPTIFRLIP